MTVIKAGTSLQLNFFFNLGCESGWTEFERACYKFAYNGLSWPSAKDACLSQDAHLTSVHSDDEQQFIESIILSNSLPTWIGGKLETFDFQWEDGSEFDYTNWDSSEPNYDGNCIIMSLTNYKWYDYDCTSLGFFVCKK